MRSCSNITDFFVSFHESNSSTKRKCLKQSQAVRNSPIRFTKPLKVDKKASMCQTVHYHHCKRFYNLFIKSLNGHSDNRKIGWGDNSGCYVIVNF